MRVTLIVGLPGSGKTTLAAQMMFSALDTAIKWFIDDISLHRSLIEDIPPSTEHLILTDPMAVLLSEDQLLMHIKEWFTGDITVDFVYCANNIKNRSDGRVISEVYVRSLSESFVKREKEIPCYDSSKETLLHIKRVNELMIDASMELLQRAKVHDASKLVSPEKEYFDKHTNKLAHLHYYSPEYKKSLADIKPALDHHYAHNSHHPAHYAEGINDMDLFDLLECIIDWKASGERQLDGNILVSLEKNKDRFGIDNQLYKILKNTVDRFYR